MNSGIVTKCNRLGPTTRTHPIGQAPPAQSGPRLRSCASDGTRMPSGWLMRMTTMMVMVMRRRPSPRHQYGHQPDSTMTGHAASATCFCRLIFVLLVFPYELCAHVAVCFTSCPRYSKAAMSPQVAPPLRLAAVGFSFVSPS